MTGSGNRGGTAGMGNSGQVTFELWTVWPEAGSGAGRRRILCPALRGLPPEDALALAILPIHDANALLLDALSVRGAGPPPDYAGICLSDPFRRIEDVLSAVRGAGIAGVVNMPSVTAMTHPADDSPFADLRDRETAMLAEARNAGFRTLRVDGEDLWEDSGEGESCLGRICALVTVRDPAAGPEGMRTL
jgi:hypothetical protein